MNLNKPNKAELERLTLLIEECAEVIQACTKIKRHGYSNFNPETPKTNNKEDLEKEIGHVMNTYKMMVKAGDISSQRTQKACFRKAETIATYLYHQEIIT